MAKVNTQVSQAPENPPKESANQGRGWIVRNGQASEDRNGEGFLDNGLSALIYNNPFSQIVERAWYQGQIVYALVGEKMHITDTDKIKAAKEYQPVYAVELDENGWMTSHKPVPGQLNIYESIPGEPEYSAIWKFYYVIVPEDYQANTLQSVEDCVTSGYDIRESNFYRN